MRISIAMLPRLVFAALTVAVVTLILAPPLILISLMTASGGPALRITIWWAWAVSKAMGLTFSIHGAEKIVPGTSYIITPNHQGNADILALLLTLPLRFKWVIKKSLVSIPLFGWALGRTGAISIDRANRQSAIRSLQKGTKNLAGGWSILIYPEGTRSPDEHLQAFKKGPFMMAVQTGFPILPITCNGAFRVLPKKTISFRPGHVTVTVGDPIPTAGLTEKDVPELMEMTRDAIIRRLDPDYDPFGKKSVSN